MKFDKFIYGNIYDKNLIEFYRKFLALNIHHPKIYKLIYHLNSSLIV